MSKIRVGVLGCANIAGRSVIPAIKNTEALELIVVASRSIDKANSFAEKFNCEALGDYDALVNREDIDALYIPLPTGMHYEWCIKALKAGKHVICEKSLAENLEEVSEIVKVAQENNLVVMENFMFEYHSQHQFVFDLLEKGDLGEIRCFRSSFGFPPFRDQDNIRYQKSLGGGALLDAGAYPLKASQIFLGKGLEVKGAFLNYDPIREVDIYGGAFLRGENGVFAEIAFGFDNYYQCNYEIWGSKGKLTAERAFTAGPGFKPKVIVETQDQRFEYALAADNHFEKIMADFAVAVKEGKIAEKHEILLDQSRLITQVRAHAN